MINLGNTVVTAAVVETRKNVKLKTTLKADFKIDSMALVLFKPNTNEVLNYKFKKQTQVWRGTLYSHNRR